MLCIEKAQRGQYDEFNNAWDEYMDDYQNTAALSLEKMKEKHKYELTQLRLKIADEYREGKFVSKDIADMRRKEKMFLQLKKYDDAERTKRKAKMMQSDE